jgi:hypothetical protein
VVDGETGLDIISTCASGENTGRDEHSENSANQSEERVEASSGSTHQIDMGEISEPGIDGTETDELAQMISVARRWLNEDTRT